MFFLMRGLRPYTLAGGEQEGRKEGGKEGRKARRQEGRKEGAIHAHG